MVSIEPKKGIRGRKDKFIQVIWNKIWDIEYADDSVIKIVNAASRKDITYKFNVTLIDAELKAIIDGRDKK